MESLIKIQSELKVHKSQYNKFGKYNYRSCEDILEAVKPLLKKYNCYLTISDDIVSVGDSIFVKAIATISDGENEISVNAFAKHPTQQKGMSDSQITGASSSYSRKYALNGLFGIDDTKDSDATNEHGQEVKKPSPKKTDSKKAQPKTKTKSAVSNLDTLIKVLDTNKEKALKQLTNDRYINKEQHSKLSKVLSKDELSKVEVR